LRLLQLVQQPAPVSRQAIVAAGASVMPLPAYSPDLNPIEQAFAKLRAGLRTAGARTRDAVWNTIGRLLDTFERRDLELLPSATPAPASSAWISASVMSDFSRRSRISAA
jgi:hypothetical protein